MQKPTLVFALVLPMILLATPTSAHAQDGRLDTSFGTDGIVTTSFSNLFFGPPRSWGLTVQEDGKIIAVGTVLTRSITGEDFLVVRYDADGALDTSFGEDGFATTDFAGGSDEAYTVAVQPDGKIVAAGGTFTGPFCLDPIVARYNPDGSPDASFGDDGKVRTHIPLDYAPNSCFLPLTLALQADGKILIGGTVDGTVESTLGQVEDSDMIVVRYRTDGTLDDDFGINGVAFLDHQGTDDRGLSLAVQADGKILIAGSGGFTGDSPMLIGRFNTDGTVDTSFGTEGVVNPAMRNGSIWDLRIQPDDKLLMRGDNALIRLMPNGTLDPTFGEGGFVNDLTLGGYLNTMLQLPSGEIIVGGVQRGSTGSDIALTRYLPDGTFDTSFGEMGLVTLDLGSVVDDVMAVAAQQDGKIIVLSDEFMLTRFLTGTSTDAETATPHVFSLEPPHPNPFRHHTTLRFTLQHPTHIHLAAYDVLGREVAVLQDGMLPTGDHTATLAADGLSTGLYLLRLTTDTGARTQVVTRIK